MTRGIGPTADPAVLAALRERVAARPDDLIARHNLAVELRKAGLIEEGIEEIAQAWDAGLRKGETALMRGNLLADAGRFEEAVAFYREAARLKPELIDAHKVLATLLPQMGSADDPLASFRSALARQPSNGQLWVEALGAARGSERHADLLALATDAERRFGADPLVLTYRAVALSGLDRDTEALAIARKVTQAHPGYLAAHTTLAHILLRMGDAAGAAEAAEYAANADPAFQAAWALLGTAWRILGDPREDWLCDYDRLVMPIEVGVSEALAPALQARHMTAAHPPDQSLRGGTQTRGHLFQTPDPVILEAAEALHAAIETRLATLPKDPTHPALRRNTGRAAFATAWSVRLRSSGHHVSHMHPSGWLSSAFYVSLPQEVASGGGQGALAFGVPDAALGLELPPRRIVQPAEGRLVLFPSYLWHGTTPFESATPRLTIAFDLVPVDNAPPKS